MDGHDLARDLRALADFYDEHPDFPRPNMTLHTFLHGDAKKGLALAARQLGTADKYIDETWYELRRAFGSIMLTVNAYRNEVCEKVLVGTKDIPEQYIPAKPAETIPAHEESVYEWQCPDSLLGISKLKEEL